MSSGMSSRPGMIVGAKEVIGGCKGRPALYPGLLQDPEARMVGMT